MHEQTYPGLDQTAAPLLGVDPRVKLVVALVWCVCVVTVPPDAMETLGLYAGLLALGVAVNHGRFRAVLANIARALPILLLLVIAIPFLKPGARLCQWGWLSPSVEGLHLAGVVFASALLCIGALALVGATTPPERLLGGLRGIGVPATLVGVIGLMLRYVQVLPSEMHLLRDARDARAIGPAGPGRVRSGGNLIGTLFLRSFDRAERVADAMAARGHGGQLHAYPQPALSGADLIRGLAGAGIIVLVRCVGLGFHG
jgi:cobalt/nickel transport system permease protein